MIKIKIDLEKIFVVSFLCIFLLLGMGYLFDRQLDHDFPYAYMASDAFQHETRAQSIKDSGNYRNEASYLIFGIENASGYYPPMIYHLAAILSHVTGLEIYDTVYQVVFLLAALGSIVMYIVIRSFNRHVALLSIPFSLLVFSGGLYTGFTWGHWPAVVAQAFLVLVIWCTLRIDLEKSFMLLGISISAVIFTHTSEAVFGGMFLGLFLIVMLITKKMNFSLIKTFILGAITSILITSYYLIIFVLVWLPAQRYKLGIQRTWDNPTIYLLDFRILLIFMAVGIIMSFFLIKKHPVPVAAALSMLLIGLGNFYGFREKAFQLRFFWPIFLSFFIGFGIYWFLKFAIRKWKFVYSVAVSVLIILIIMLGNFSFMPHYNKIDNPIGMMNPLHWQMFNWIADSTDKNSIIYFFYGDMYSQDAVLRSSKRHHLQITPEGMMDAINSREIRRIYDTENPGDHGGSAPLRKSFFKFVSGIKETYGTDLNGPRDICQYDYFVFDRVSRQDAFAKYNMIIANELMSRNSTDLVFQNDFTVVLKNKYPGGDCIEKRNF